MTAELIEYTDDYELFNSVAMGAMNIYFTPNLEGPSKEGPSDSFGRITRLRPTQQYFQADSPPSGAKEACRLTPTCYCHSSSYTVQLFELPRSYQRQCYYLYRQLRLTVEVDTERCSPSLLEQFRRDPYSLLCDLQIDQTEYSEISKALPMAGSTSTLEWQRRCSFPTHQYQDPQDPYVFHIPLSFPHHHLDLLPEGVSIRCGWRLPLRATACLDAIRHSYQGWGEARIRMVQTSVLRPGTLRQVYPEGQEYYALPFPQSCVHLHTNGDNLTPSAAEPTPCGRPALHEEVSLATPVSIEWPQDTDGTIDTTLTESQEPLSPRLQAIPTTEHYYDYYITQAKSIVDLLLFRFPYQLLRVEWYMHKHLMLRASGATLRRLAQNDLHLSSTWYALPLAKNSSTEITWFYDLSRQPVNHWAAGASPNLGRFSEHEVRLRLYYQPTEDSPRSNPQAPLLPAVMNCYNVWRWDSDHCCLAYTIAP